VGQACVRQAVTRYGWVLISQLLADRPVGQYWADRVLDKANPGHIFFLASSLSFSSSSRKPAAPCCVSAAICPSSHQIFLLEMLES
jgi:hypothetical protein